MKKILLALFSLILLGIGLMFGNISLASFEEMGKPGGMLVLGKLVVTNFIKNDFSLWIFIISLTLFLCFLCLSLILFSLLFSKRENKSAMVS
ncbi:MAG: hypothetical protein WC849_00955 [Candidatus Paceibacterota bacterium]